MAPRNAVSILQVDMGRSEDPQHFCYAQKASGQAAHKVKNRRDTG